MAVRNDAIWFDLNVSVIQKYDDGMPYRFNHPFSRLASI